MEFVVGVMVLVEGMMVLVEEEMVLVEEEMASVEEVMVKLLVKGEVRAALVETVVKVQLFGEKGPLGHLEVASVAGEEAC